MKGVERPEAGPSQKPDFFRRAVAPALKIAMVYLIISCAWIILSDWAVSYFIRNFTNPEMSPAEHARMHTNIDMIKGIAFVLISSLVFFLLSRYHLRSLLATEHEATLALEKSAADFRLLFQNNPLPMWLVDTADMSMVAVNNQALSLLGYGREEFLKLKTTALVHPSQHERLKAIAPEFANAPPTPRVWLFRRKNDSTVEVELTGHIMDLDGKRVRMVVAIDVTQRLAAERALDDYRRELETRVAQRTEDLSRSNQRLTDEVARRQRVEEQLRRATAVAEEASDAKSSFLARTTHEIRLPLTAVLGYADLILDTEAPSASAHRHAAVIRRNASRLMTLIEDLLDLSRIEARRLHVHLAAASPRAILQELDEMFRPQMAEKSLDLTIEICPAIPETIRTDPARLRQILVNLVGNALKFTTKGGVAIAAAGDAGNLTFTVRDSGPGIPAEQLGQLFTPFYQANNNAFGGTGLGLAISRQLATLLGGTITAANAAAPERGAIFTLTLPRHPAEAEAAAPAVVEVKPLEVSILIAEDDPHIRWLVERFLENAGASVAAASTGTEAIAAARQARDAGRPFALIILDMHMPEMSGPQTAAALRKELGVTAPIVGLTASPDPADRDALLQAGCNAVAFKPIDRPAFIKMLQEQVGG